MKSWYFSEQSYYPAWENGGSTRITIPSSVIDPERAHMLLNEFLAECRLCDQLGLNIMANEHHGSSTCMSVSCLLSLGVLAAQTKNARLLALGVPIMNRMDPYRVAEEAAYVDVLSRGRLELGLIKGSVFELYMSNSNPVTSGARYWEAHDLVTAALTEVNGPFRWESEHFNYRYVNVLPRCYQQPHPPMWVTTLSTRTAQEAARRGFVVAITGVAGAARAAYPIYREEYLKTFGRPAELDRFAYLGMVAVAKDEKTGLERGRKLLHFLEAAANVEENLLNPPGSFPHADSARMIRAGKPSGFVNKALPDGTPMSNPPTPKEQIINQALFAGTPDQVYEQIAAFYRSVGGFGHLLVQMGGTMSHEEICDSIKLYAEEVQPRLDRLSLG